MFKLDFIALIAIFGIFQGFFVASLFWLKKNRMYYNQLFSLLLFVTSVRIAKNIVVYLKNDAGLVISPELWSFSVNIGIAQQFALGHSTIRPRTSAGSRSRNCRVAAPRVLTRSSVSGGTRRCREPAPGRWRGWRVRRPERSSCSRDCTTPTRTSASQRSAQHDCTTTPRMRSP